jgi:hypothetical protein
MQFFSLEHGIFQGNTLSPRLFLLMFAPVIAIVEKRNDLGYTPTVAIPNSEGLLPVGSYAYVLWDESESDEPRGWYKCKVEAYKLNGYCQVTYPDDQTEELNLQD